MDQSSWGLRIALLLIGLVVIVGVYLFSVIRRRRRAERYQHSAWSSPRFGRTDLADNEDDLDPVNDEIIAVRVHKVEPLSDLPVIKNDIDDAERTREETPSTRRSSRPPRPRRKRGEDQLSLGFPGDPEPPAGRRKRASPTETALLSLYLRPRGAASFSGPVLVRNANVVGLRHGEHQIFHHFGAGDLSSKQPLFSLANMFEPGYFDMGRIEAFQTAGVVMFMNLPTELDGPVAFELFLNTAQRLAEGLQAELLHDPKTLLDSASIDDMRRIAAQF
jgi:cell division protein ZipA